MFCFFSSRHSHHTILHTTRHFSLSQYTRRNDDGNAFCFAVLALALSSAFSLAHYHDLLFGIIRICGANKKPCLLCICTLAYPSSSAVPSLSSRTRISKTHAAAGNPSPSDPETSHHGHSPVLATSILFWFCYAVQPVHVVAFLFDIHLRHSTPAFPRSLIQDILY